MPYRAKPSFVIFDIRALWRSGLSERQSVRMSKITNDGTGCFIAILYYPYGNSGRQSVNALRVPLHCENTPTVVIDALSCGCN